MSRLITLRDYQQEAVSAVIIGKTNLIYNGIRSGKSVVLWGISQKYSNKKILILAAGRKIVEQLRQYYGDEASFILSGKDMDLSKRILVGTYQTLRNRPEVDLESFDILQMDEAHRYFNNKLVKHLVKTIPTVIGYSGSPINAKGAKLQGYDNWIRTITLREMLERGYLSPVRYFSLANFTEGHEGEMKTSRQDFDESVIERVMDESTLLENVKKRILEKKYHTEHKVLMYVSSISMGEKVLNCLELPNVKIIHSNLSNKEVTQTMEWFDSKDTNGILINCKILTEGYDNKYIDGILCLSPTKIRSLFIQRNMRQATRLEGKEGFYDDFSGNLSRFNPYDLEFTQKHKKPCKEACEEFGIGTLAYDMCVQSCLPSEEIGGVCSTNPPLSHVDNPYSVDFQTKGNPCGEIVPVWEKKFKTVRPEGTIGLIYLWSQCKCGFLTRRTIETITQPSKVIEMYSDVLPQNKVTALYSKEHKKALLWIDDIKDKKMYTYKYVSTPEEAYVESLQYFKGRKFSLISNVPMKKITNSASDPRLNELLQYVDWEDIDNQKIVYSLIENKVKELTYRVGFKRGFTYHFMKGTNSGNEKETYKKVQKDLGKAALLTLYKKLNGE